MPQPDVVQLLFLEWVRKTRFRDRPSACLHCHSSAVIRWGRFSDRQRYRCRTCGRTFSDLTGTLLAGTKRASAWPLALRAMEEGATLRETARLAGIDPSTAFRWRHQILETHARRTLRPWSHSIVLHRHALGFVPRRGDRLRGTVSSRRVPGTWDCSLKAAFWVLSIVGRHGPRRPPGLDLRAMGPNLFRVPAAPAEGGLATWIGPRGIVWAREGTVGTLAAAARRAGRDFRDIRSATWTSPARDPHPQADQVAAQNSAVEIRRWIRRFRGISSDRANNYLVWKRILSSPDHGYARVPSAKRGEPRLPVLRFLLPFP